MANGWKIAFWIVLIILIIETVSVFYLVSLGLQVIEDEADCSINICADAETYYFDTIEDMCYCFENDEVVLQRYLG